MAVESAADRLEFLDVDEFGVTATYDGASTIQGIFDKDYIELLQGEVGIASTGPQMLCRSSDVSGVVQGKAVVVGGVSYTVKGIEPDGTGMTLLLLEAV